MVTVKVYVPLERHDVFTGDFTHVRVITVNAFNQFSKKHCTETSEKFGGASGHAFKLNIDFEVVDFGYDYDPFYQPLLDMLRTKVDNNTMSAEEEHMITRLGREANNFAMHTKIKLKVVKNDD